jgi:hypothetical protein
VANKDDGNVRKKMKPNSSEAVMVDGAPQPPSASTQLHAAFATRGLLHVGLTTGVAPKTKPEAMPRSAETWIEISAVDDDVKGTIRAAPFLRDLRAWLSPTVILPSVRAPVFCWWWGWEGADVSSLAREDGSDTIASTGLGCGSLRVVIRQLAAQGVMPMVSPFSLCITSLCCRRTFGMC